MSLSPRTFEVHDKQSVYPVVKRDRGGNIMTIFAVGSTPEKAQEIADNANAWYGPDHPLTPLTVVQQDTIFFDPKPFPSVSRSETDD